MKPGLVAVLSCWLAACGTGSSGSGTAPATVAAPSARVPAATPGAQATAPAATSGDAAAPGAQASAATAGDTAAAATQAAAAGAQAPAATSGGAQAAGAQAPAPAAPGDPPWPIPPGWRAEVIPFPLEFSPWIAHRGREVLRFPPGFFDPAAGDYWSYAFIWRTEDPARMDATTLGAELTAYFSGLIAAVDRQQRVRARDDIAARATPDGPNRFRLAAHVFDAFKTAAPLDLTGWAARRPCRAGALWVFVLAPAATTIRQELEELARAARCAL